MSQVGDDVQKMFDHEALFKRAATMISALQAERKAMLETVDDIIRASNTLMLLLVGDLPLTKQALETAVRRSLAARTAWDDLGITQPTEAKP